jgi:hypothetical protein
MAYWILHFERYISEEFESASVMAIVLILCHRNSFDDSGQVPHWKNVSQQRNHFSR